MSAGGPGLDRKLKKPMTRETVSVVIPVFNGSNYLAAALSSVEKQTFPGVLVASYPNAGPAVTRNRGIELATGNWVAFLDHDDLWEPDKLERQMNLIRTTMLEPDVCVCARQLFSEAGLGIIQRAPKTANIVRTLYIRCFFVPSAVVARRSLLVKVGGFDITMKGAEDWDLWLKLHEAGGRFVSCPEALCLYRVHLENRSGNAYMMYRSEMQVYDRHIGPTVNGVVRPFHRLHMRSELLSELAVMEREQGALHLEIMLKALVIFPLGHWRRYKIAAHMLWTKMTR